MYPRTTHYNYKRHKGSKAYKIFCSGYKAVRVSHWFLVLCMWPGFSEKCFVTSQEHLSGIHCSEGKVMQNLSGHTAWILAMLWQISYRHSDNKFLNNTYKFWTGKKFGDYYKSLRASFILALYAFLCSNMIIVFSWSSWTSSYSLLKISLCIRKLLFFFFYRLD